MKTVGPTMRDIKKNAKAIKKVQAQVTDADLAKARKMASKHISAMNTISPRIANAKADAPVLDQPRVPTTRDDLFSSKRPVNQGASPRGWHAIEAMFHCGKKFELEHYWKVRRPMTMTPDALGVGGLFHQFRAHWFNSNFQTGAAYWETAKAFVEEAALLYALPVKDDTIRRTLHYADQYATYWSARVKPRVKHVEYPLKASILPPEFDDRTARIDDVSEYPDSNWKLAVGECKTASTDFNRVISEYTLHGQPVKQVILWEAAENGERTYGPVEYVLLDIIIKGYGKEKCQFARSAVRVYDHTKNWFLPMLAHKVTEAQRIMDGNPGERNITSCTRAIGKMLVPCTYRDLCQRGKSATPAYVDSTGTALSSPKYTKMDGRKPWD